jgi:hypothetical protein
MLPILEAASAGAAHTFLGADRLFVLLALGALRRCGSDSVRVGAWWALGSFGGLFVLGNHLFPGWREAVEWNMYISGLVIVCFGIHVTIWQHLYADTDRFQHTWEVAWNEVETGKCFPHPPFAHEAETKMPRFLVPPSPCQMPSVAAVVLGFIQGSTSPDFAFVTGSAWVDKGHAIFLYGAFTAAIAACACAVSASSWMLTSSSLRSAKGHRKARRNVGCCLCAAGFLWLTLVLQLDFQIASASHQAAAAGASIPHADNFSSSATRCPFPVDINGVKFGSAPTWEMVASLDPWWTKDLVNEHRRPPFQFSIGASSLGGCGVIANQDLPAGARIGLAGILSGPWDYSASLVHVTPWLGIAVNHCGHGNAELRAEGGLLMLDLKKPVSKGKEITFDYDSAADTIPIERAQPDWTC